MQKITPMRLLIFGCIKLSNPTQQLQNIEVGKKEGEEKKKKNCSKNTGHSKGKNAINKKIPNLCAIKQNASTSLSFTGSKHKPDMLIFSNSML